MPRLHASLCARSRRSIAVAGVITVALILAGFLPSSAAAVARTPSAASDAGGMTAAPTTDLVDFSIVTVHLPAGSLDPSTAFEIAQCNESLGCDEHRTTGSADSEGGAEIVVVVRLRIMPEGPLVCVPAKCYLAAMGVLDGKPAAFGPVVLHFRANPEAGSRFNAIPPTRALDTRTTTGGWAGPLEQGSVRVLPLAGAQAGLGIPEDATAVTATVTVTGATKDSYVKVWPADTFEPDPYSTINFGAGETTANTVTIALGDGSLAFANHAGTVDVVVDVVGYFASTGLPLGREGVLFSTQDDGIPITAGAPRTFQVDFYADIPLLLHVFAMDGTAPSYLSVNAGGPSPDTPATSFLNYGPDQDVTNTIVTLIDGQGRFTISTHAGSVHAAIEVLGSYSHWGEEYLHPLRVPVRVIDSRANVGIDGALGSYEHRQVPVPSVVATPNAMGLVLNTTATNATETGGVKVGGADNGHWLLPPYEVSFRAGQTVANTTLPTARDRTYQVDNALGHVDVIGDLTAYYDLS